MAQNARIKLTSTSLLSGGVCDEIMGIGKKTGVKVKGPTHFLLNVLMLSLENPHVEVELKHMKNGKCVCTDELLILMLTIRQ